MHPAHEHHSFSSGVAACKIVCAIMSFQQHMRPEYNTYYNGIVKYVKTPLFYVKKGCFFGVSRIFILKRLLKFNFYFYRIYFQLIKNKIKNEDTYNNQIKRT